MTPATTAILVAAILLAALVLTFGRAVAARLRVRRAARKALEDERRYGAAWEAATRAAVEAGAVALPMMRSGGLLMQVLRMVPARARPGLEAVGFVPMLSVDDKGEPCADYRWHSGPPPVTVKTATGFRFERPALGAAKGGARGGG